MSSQISDTNELILMEFTIDGECFGVDVSKVCEIMKYSVVNPMQNTCPFIEGVFKPREEAIIVISLDSYLNLNASSNIPEDIFIITKFSKLFAFHVHKVVGVNHISGEKIQKPDYISGERWKVSIITGIAEFENRLITILDFEKIISEIYPENLQER